MSRILKIEDFINESRGASFKNRTPDRFYEPESGKIQKQMLDKYNSILRDYFFDYSYFDFSLDNLSLEYDGRDAAYRFFKVNADIRTGEGNNPYIIQIYFEANTDKTDPHTYLGDCACITDKYDKPLFHETTDLTSSQINFLSSKGFEPFFDENEDCSCLKIISDKLLIDGFYNWLTKEKGVENTLTLADDIPEITRGNNLVNISFAYRPNEDTWHGSTEPTKARDVDFEDFVRDTVLAYNLLPLYYMDYICDKALGD